jgi:hypothetical protein
MPPIKLSQDVSPESLAKPGIGGLSLLLAVYALLPPLHGGDVVGEGTSGPSWGTSTHFPVRPPVPAYLISSVVEQMPWGGVGVK